ncbi:MAG: 50S ribosomal protein L18 [Pseudomonadota bacterium]|uniref:50S ribosomal protein L18 n=1 Tax=Thermithiobacillus tepidarius TaxID=929 RepID=UPI00041838B9|nr:50S ribosomal protein L18 [Thermithiobacillus tepidarius]
MKDKKAARLRRALRTRAKIKSLKQPRLCVFRSSQHIYAQIIDDAQGRVLVQASSLEADMRSKLASGGNCEAASQVGQRLAEKAVAAGLETVAFDRSGFKYHGRVKALADAARAHGLKF